MFVSGVTGVLSSELNAGVVYSLWYRYARRAPSQPCTVPLTGARGTVNIRFSENENNSVLTTELRRTGVSSNYNSVVVVVSVRGVHGADARGDVVGLVDPAAGCCRLLVHTDGGGQPALKQRGHRLAVS